jgi:hypothetical protein
MYPLYYHVKFEYGYGSDILDIHIHISILTQTFLE